MSDIEQVEYQALLFDFYGELLTDKQKDYFESHICDDLTVSEIAEEKNVSRQAVHDLIKRTNKILQGYEDRLHLVEKFLKIKDQIIEIDRIAKDSGIIGISDLTSDILEEL